MVILNCRGSLDRSVYRPGGESIHRHCEEQSDVAIHRAESVMADKDGSPRPDRSRLAMTGACHCEPQSGAAIHLAKFTFGTQRPDSSRLAMTSLRYFSVDQSESE